MLATTRRHLLLLAILLSTAPAVAAALQPQAVGVALQPKSATRAPHQVVKFTATVAGSTDQNVTWLVNGVPGGAPSIGIITPTGQYTAPADVPTGFNVDVQAVAEADPLAVGTAPVSISAMTVSAATFHVATGGNDANDGSAAHPWRTIRHAAATVPAGATVQVHAGVYHEVVTITRSGNATAGFTTYEAAPGEAAIVDGTGLTVGNDGQQGLFTLHNASWVRVAGFEVRNFRSSVASQVPVGIYVYGSGNHVELLNNHVHDIVTTVQTSNGDALGMAIYGSAATPITWLLVDGNEVDHLVTGFSESLTVNGNVQHWQVTNNRVHDNNNIGIDAIGFEGTGPTADVDQARDGWIAGNSVFNISSTTNPAYNHQPGADGIYVDGGTRITIERNLVDHADLGIELASEHASRTTSYVTARSNLVSFSTITGISIGGYASGVGGTDHCTIVNNTLFGNDTALSGSGEFQVQYHASANVFADNIVYANAQGLLVNSFVGANAAPAALDYNLYDTSAGTGGAQWVWKNHTYTTLAAFRTASAGEAHGLLADPKFTSTAAASFDLHLAGGSPGIDSGSDAGKAVQGGYDFDGAQRKLGPAVDRGAYEQL